MSRDIDQEVSDTLCTLLSFDEDNFLSQEEVEENLRNCPNIGQYSAIEKIYQDYNTGNSTNSKIDDTTNDNETCVSKDAPAAPEENEVTQMLQNMLDDVQMEKTEDTQILQNMQDDVQMEKAEDKHDPMEETAENHTSYTPNDNEIGASIEAVLNPFNAAIADDPASNLTQRENEIKTEFVCEPEQITEELLPPPPPPIETESDPQPENEAGDTSCNITNEHVNVKLEFTCESEKITEEQLDNYYIEDEYKKGINFNYGLTQIEIGTINEVCEKNDENPDTNLIDSSLLNQNLDQSNASVEECIFNIDDDRDLSNIMSDHNYTSQEKPPNTENLQKLLVSHILSKGSSVSVKVVTDFVEKTLESINLFGVDNESQQNFNDMQSKDLTGVLDIFADGKSTKQAIFDESLNDLATIKFREPDSITAGGASNEITAKTTQEISSKTNAECRFMTEGENEFHFQEDMVYTTISVSSLASPPANCSEPLEHCSKSIGSMNAVTIESIPENETCSTSTKLNNLPESETEKNTQRENHINTERITQEDDEATLEHTSCSKELERGDETQNEVKVSNEIGPEVQEKDENIPAVLTSEEKSSKIAMFNEELGKMAIDDTEDICDELNTTEEFPGIQDTSKTADETIVENDYPKTDVQLAVIDDINEFKAMNISSVPSPPENCSEPLEHTTFDEAFDLNCNEKLTVINHLDSLKSFAKSLSEDCETFTSSTTTIENKLQKYMQEKLEIFKKIVKSAAAFPCEEKCIQTDERLSKRKLRKLNQNNKKVLLDPTDSSSSSDLSSSENSIKSQVARVRVKRTSNNSQLDSATQINSDNKKESIAADYDDGVALVEYTQSEVFEPETFCNDTFTHIRKINNNDSLSDVMESDLEDTWHRKKSNTVNTVRKGSQNESDKENSAGKAMSNNKSMQDDGDKEIERLINLNGLIKRSNLGMAKSAESNERVKTKSLNSKNKDIIDAFTDDDIQAEIFSDPSISESEEEITETQFLKRCNENVKQQLLSDSNSDLSESDVTDDIEEILSSNEGSDSPLVERFLKKFNANESDDEESEKCDNINIKSSIPQEINDSKNSLTDKNKSNSSENSDCEMLDDMVTSTKQSKQKSLEKMLSVMEKRKKMNRLCDSISLSSESESSDVEAVEETNSRIKPMLRPEQLATVTREAQRHESERIRRLEKKHKTLTKLLKERPDVQEDLNLILDYNDETKTFIKVHPDIVKHLKQHQREGVRFMYDSCYGGIEALKKSPGSGCILAHCMGLGKTLQLIALLHTVISYKELKTCKVLVLCPKSTVMNWADEIERWLGPLKPKYYTFNDTSDVNDKIQIIKDWSAATPNSAGILLIGYEAFRTLVFYHSYKNRGIAQSRLESIRNDVDKYLLSPGADLVVCDEGHIIKNSKSAISLAVSQIKTPKRIVLTGTPIQNNLKEYYSMVNFIKPLFLGTEKEFANLYANPIKNGQHKDSSKRDIQVMKQRSFVLHKKLSKFVQRKEAELLKTFLPQKYEYVLFIPMTKVQTILYEHILTIISKKEDRGKGLITDYTCLRKIWTHPKVLEDAWINATAQKHRKDSRKTQAVHSDDDQPDDVYDSQTGVISVTNDWWRNLLADKDLETILPSNKLRTMFEILRMCEEKGEKCLIFSAFVAVLNVVEYFFKKMNDKDPDTLNELKMSQGYQVKNTWILGKDYYRLDGKTPKLIRHSMIEQFNMVSNKRARVFLISSRAGGQGINLTGANRVIILDTSWNPSNDQQNIFRIFRLGQKKNCYIYRLIAMGTMEEKVYSRSVTKQAMSFRVVDEQQIDRHYSMAELTELYSLTTPDYENRPMPDCPQDSILASLLLNYPSLVYKYHEHDSLLENKVEQELSEQEKQDAWAAYERDQQMNSEIREMPNPDEVQNNLAAPKFPPYLGSSLSAFNQMSALFNYGNFSPASLSPYLPYLSHLGNYSASNQQYLEMRKRLAEGTFPYPDISTSLGNTPFNTPFPQNPPKSISTNPLIPDMSNLHSNALHTNPLSALGDLSMFGLGNANTHMAHNVNTSTMQQRQHSSPTYASAANPTSANSMQANFDYQMYENSLKSLVNYRHDFSGSGNSMNNKSKAGNMAPVNQFKNPLYPQTSNVNYDKNAMPLLNSPSPKAMEQQAQKQHTDKSAAKTSSDMALPLNVTQTTRNDANLNKNNYVNVGNSTSGARNSPLPQVATKRTYPSDVNISNVTNTIEDRLTPNQKSTKDAQHSGMSNFQAYKNNNNTTNSGSSSSIYTSKNITGKTTNDNMNSNKSSMQIIPTTSPPGTTSVTKQYTDISPSISLTAVTSSNTSKNSNNTNFNQSKNLQKNPSTNKMPTNSSSNNPADLTKSSTPYPITKFLGMNKKPINPPVSKSNLLPTKPKSTSSDSIQKSSTPTTSTQNSYQQNSNNEIGTKLLSAVNSRNKNTIHKKAQNLTVQQIKPATTNIRTAATITAVKTQNGSNLKSTTSKAVPSQQIDVRKMGVSMEKRKSPINTTQSSTTGQAQKVSTSASDALKIQANSANKSGASSNDNMLTYILETCINQKKFAIGAPTKGGGGTTVTRVQTQGKRKNTDSIPKDAGSNEIKRAK